MRLVLLVVGLLFLVPNAFAAPKIPTLQVCANGTNLTVKQRCGRGDSRLTPASVLNFTNFYPRSCARREQAVTGQVNGVKLTVTCNQGEFLLTHGGESDNTAVLIVQANTIEEDETTISTGKQYPVGAYYTFQNILSPTAPFGAKVTLVCCAL